MSEQVEAGSALAPWEIPPDESYWRALLMEGEYGEGAADPILAPAPQTAAIAPDATGDADGSTLEAESALPDSVPDSTQTQAPESAPVPTPGNAPVQAPSDSSAPGRAADATLWDTLRACQDEDREVELVVVDYNRGGLLVKWDSVIGFVPASQLCDGVASGDEAARQEAFREQVGNRLTLKVIEVDPNRGRLILSERAAHRVLEPDLSVLDSLAPGDVRHGTVTNICSFGVFVDLGGIEGLIHISELSWGRVSHPSDVLQSGDPVDVYVLNVDRDRGRIGLSVKRLYPDPWETVEERYSIDQTVEGTVTNIVNFGAFVRLEEGLEGLVHNSEWGDPVLQRSVQEGDVVQVRIISLDGERHRMGLSLESVVTNGPGAAR
ncbi:MAG: S1 RNA-binding domain-containing protein [Anaerolineae bacterium]|nr:S1 RNA-binding domain-containing protein [Anaerolineae bacterium]